VKRLGVKGSHRSGIAGCGLLVLVALPQADAGAADPEEFVFPKLNRAYGDLVPEFAPIVQGPVVIELSSPRQSLTVRSHKVTLTPLADGSHTARLELEFVGKGWLVGDIAAGGLSTRVQDELLIPPQTLDLAGRVRLARGQGGYTLTALELPARVEVAIRSRVATDLVGWCDRVSMLALALFDCGGLDRALSRAVVPLPAAGESYFLADEELTDADRAALDRYLRPGS